MHSAVVETKQINALTFDGKRGAVLLGSALPKSPTVVVPRRGALVVHVDGSHKCRHPVDRQVAFEDRMKVAVGASLEHGAKRFLPLVTLLGKNTVKTARTFGETTVTTFAVAEPVIVVVPVLAETAASVEPEDPSSCN